MSMASEGGPSAVLTQACENCRRRKVKCNRQDPCSNCLTSNLECRPAKRMVEHRPRVVLSSNYQKSIDEINDRLVSIEQLVKSLSLNDGSSNSSRPTNSDTSSTSGILFPGPPKPKPKASPDPVSTLHTPGPTSFEGESSFATQTVLAGEIIGKSAQGIQPGAEILDALSSLKDLMKTSALDGASHGFDDLYFEPDEQPKSLPEMEIIPAQFVISILRKLKEYPSVHYLAYAMRDQMSVEKVCQAVYFPTEPVTIGQLTLMHGLLLFLLQEYIALNDPIVREWDVNDFVRICEKNVHIGCQSYELLAVPTIDNIKALLLGIVLAQLSSKPLLSWTLCSAAARHCFTLGYHRERSLESDPPEIADDKRHTFWSLYSIDKNLSLNLGRVSNFPDFDIDTKYFSVSIYESIAPWDRAAVSFIFLSKVQGQVYDQLYSTSALQKSQAERNAIIAQIDSELRPWLNEWREISGDCRGAYYPEYFDLLFGPCDIIYYSMQTTLHRAASMGASTTTTEITAACFEAATNGLLNHLKFLPIFTRKAGRHSMDTYVSWILLYTSFTPLIVVFLHSIASYDMSDVKLLHDFLDSIEPIADVTKDCKRLYEVTKVFCRVAKALVESQHAHAGLALGTYSHQSNTLLLPQDRNIMNISSGNAGYGERIEGGQSLPDIFMQDFEGVDGQVWSEGDVEAMSTFFGNWMGSSAPIVDMLNLDFSSCF